MTPIPFSTSPATADPLATTTAPTPSAAAAAAAADLLTDEQLVARTLSGAKDAFNQLVLRHERRLYRFLVKTAHDPADAEDAAQQAFIKAYTNLARYNPRWRFTTWLFTIALRELRTIRRRYGRTASLAVAHEPTAAEPIDDQPGDLWHAARLLLTTQHYTALWLRHGEDLPVRDVARVMQRPRVWVSVTLHRAVATLRKSLTPDGNTLSLRRGLP